MDTSRGWPKVVAPLTPEEQAVHNDFVRYWHEILPQRYGAGERFNHGYAARSLRRADPGRVRTLELGAGLGEHLAYEDLGAQEYTCVELRPEMARMIKQRFSEVEVIVADCQERMSFADGSFDRILAVHVLEHLPNLPAALDECVRLLRIGGVFSIVIPCDPGLVYAFARRISAQRLFERRYNRPYRPFIRREHLNSPSEIVSLLQERFTIVHRRFFPLRVPLRSANLCLGLTVEKGATPLVGGAHPGGRRSRRGGR